MSLNGEKWSWITSEGEIEDEPPSVDDLDSSCSESLEISTDDKIKDGHQEEGTDEAESDSSSDIERIEEPSLIEIENVELPEYNIETQRDTEEAELEVDVDDDDDDDGNKQLVPVDNLVHVVIDRFRHNQVEGVRNFIRSVAVLLAIAFGVACLLGSFSQRLQVNQFEESRMEYLKKMQGENDQILNNLQRKLDQNKDVVSSILCYRKVKYWKEQYEVLLSENQDLQRILSDENEIKSECDKELEVEQEKLKQNLFLTQVEFVEAVKQFELTRKQEQLNREKVNLLREENEVLRVKLQEENDLDKEDEKLLHFLMKENIKFRMELEEMEEKSTMSSGQIIQTEVDTLRQKINQLHLENEDLRQVIARLRYGRPYESMDKQQTIEQLQTENGELKVEIGKMRNAQPQESEKDDQDSRNSDMIDLDSVKKVIEKFYSSVDDEKNALSNSTWSFKGLFKRSKTRKAFRKIGGTIVDVFKGVVSKTNRTIFEVWSSGLGVKLRNTTTHFLIEVEKTWNDSGKVLKATTSKVLDAVHAIDVKKTKKVIDNFVKKLWNLVGSLKREREEESPEKKNIIQEPKNGKPKHDARRSVEYDNDHVGKDGQEEAKNNAEWMFSRAQSREERHERQKQADWLFDRARDRREKYAKQNKADWLFDRARDRKEQREIKFENEGDGWKKKKGDRGEDVNWYLKKNKRTNIREQIRKTRRYNRNKDGGFEDDEFDRKPSRDRKKTITRENWRFFEDSEDDETCESHSNIRPCGLHEDVDQETLFGSL